ncbi:AAA family ATPase [Stenotrophomonas maltophilia]|uniref:AAA family ATPase n=1 Tax=Stenotrophomonas maltophilia TaxID=40324 RepID=UPI0016607153|nr:ATP-binding protein [Stenotrophomonas maltophilia]
MLVEFSVENFRSIRERLTFSLVAAKGDERRDSHVIPSPAPATPDLLRSAVIYGANAAGKSNLMKAIKVLDLVVTDTKAVGNPNSLVGHYQPFLGDSDSRNRPTQFNVTFVDNSVRFDYWIAFDAERIVGESLYAFPEGRAQRWFERSCDDDGDAMVYGGALRGPKKSWELAAEPNVSFLATAKRMKSEQLSPIYNWFRKELRYLLNAGKLRETYTADSSAGSEVRKSNVMEVVAKADLGIADFGVSKVPMDINVPEPFGEKFRSMIQEALGEDVPEVDEVRIVHRSETGHEMILSLDEESSGTGKLFALAGPWIDTLEHGYTLLIDELDTHLHPMMLNFMLETFNNKNTNPKGAQLVFTTHNTAPLSKVRRDQVWFAEKTASLSTQLTPLSDFSPRKLENIERGYLDGRYGGVPFLGYLDFGRE